MKYLGKITDPKDLVTKEYADTKVPRLAELPTPSAEHAGKIVEYVGATTSQYIRGALYECKSGTKNHVKVEAEGQGAPLPYSTFYCETMPPSEGYIDLFLDAELTQPTEYSAQGSFVYVGTEVEWRLEVGDITSTSPAPVTEIMWEQIEFTHWGKITGTLSDQTDLQTALDGKQKTITVSTAAPSGGDDGDIWIQVSA